MTATRTKCPDCDGYGGDGGQTDTGRWEWPCETCGGTGRAVTTDPTPTEADREKADRIVSNLHGYDPSEHLSESRTEEAERRNRNVIAQALASERAALEGKVADAEMQRDVFCDKLNEFIDKLKEADRLYCETREELENSKRAHASTFDDLEQAQARIAELESALASSRAEALESFRKFIRIVRAETHKNDDSRIGSIEDELDARIRSAKGMKGQDDE